MQRLVVVGAGIAGLAGARAAVLEAERHGLGDLEVVVLEASDRIGGKLFTEDVDGITVEWGPDAFLAAKPRGRGLVEELGLGDRITPVAPAARRAFLYQGGRLKPLPQGLAMGVPTTLGAARRARAAGLLPWAGAVRAAIEPLLPGKPIGEPDEPAATTVRRRLGRPAATRLVEPLLQGVFGARGTEIGVRSAFPQAVGRRSLARSLRRRPGRPSPDEPQFLALDGGFRTLVDSLAGGLPEGAIRTNARLATLTAGSDGGLELRASVGGRADTPPSATGGVSRIERADAVMLAATSDAAGAALAELAPEAASAFGSIRYGGSAVVVLRYPDGSLVRTTDGSGFLVDPEEGLATAACSWYSAKWPQLTGGHVVLRAVVTDPKRLAASDDDLSERVVAEMDHVMGARTEPDLVRMKRWEQALPIFKPGHHDMIRAALEHLPTNVAVAGAFLGAVGIPDCVESGEAAARRLVAVLAPPAGRR